MREGRGIMSGVGLLVKTFTPRRRKRGDKRPEPVETKPPDLVATCCDDPITPPPAFLPPGHVKAGYNLHFLLFIAIITISAFADFASIVII